jgi:peroxiredoxin/tetratricopeptide (TPR) repeat protein
MLLRCFAALLFSGVLGAQTTAPGLPTADEAARLEAALESKPDDVPARTRLMTYYRFRDPNGEARVKHLVWFIEHRPEDPILQTSAAIEGDAFSKIAEAWKKRLAGEGPLAAMAYANATQFFETADAGLARKIAKDGLAKYPDDAEIAVRIGRVDGLLILGAKGMDRYGRVAAFDEEVARSDTAALAWRELETTSNANILAGAGDAMLGQVFFLDQRGRERQAQEVLTRSEAYLERARKLNPRDDRTAAALRRAYQSASAVERDPAKRREMLERGVAVEGDAIGRWHLLSNLARAQVSSGAYGKAAESASELLGNAPQYPDDWNYGNAMHWGNIVLGRVALKEDKVEEARKRLLAAGATKGSPQLNSFGPDWDLARELVNKGEKDAVLEYIELCRKFWKLDRGALDFWAKAIRDGGVPRFTMGEASAGAGRNTRDVAKLVGNRAPGLSLKDLSGKTVTLADFQGKVVVLDFWAVWCAPCRSEMPVFEKLYREFADQDVAVLTIDVDEPRATPAQYLKDEKLTFPVLIAEGTDTLDRYGVHAFPTTMVIDGEGKVTAFAVGSHSEAELRELIAKARK